MLPTKIIEPLTTKDFIFTSMTSKIMTNWSNKWIVGCRKRLFDLCDEDQSQVATSMGQSEVPSFSSFDWSIEDESALDESFSYLNYECATFSKKRMVHDMDTINATSDTRSVQSPLSCNPINELQPSTTTSQNTDPVSPPAKVATIAPPKPARKRTRMAAKNTTNTASAHEASAIYHHPHTLASLYAAASFHDTSNTTLNTLPNYTASTLHRDFTVNSTKVVLIPSSHPAGKHTTSEDGYIGRGSLYLNGPLKLVYTCSGQSDAQARFGGRCKVVNLNDPRLKLFAEFVVPGPTVSKP